MIEAVIFDMDGVLADTEYYYENRRKNFLLENGIPIPEGNFIGSNEKAIWEALVPNDPVRRQEMLMAYREYRKARPTPYGKLTDPQAEPLMNALRSRGLKVAVLDADLAGASMAQLLGASGPVTSDKDKVNPVQVDDHIKLLSYNLIADALSEPVLWPGGDIFNVVNYLYTSGNWGEDNDVFLIDMPSGAGDVPINLYTAFPVDGTIIVGEPSELAVVPLQRCVAMTRMFLSAPVAYVENKSLDGGAHLASRLDLGAKCVDFALPLSPELASAPGGVVTAEMASLVNELTDRVVSLLP